MLRTNKKIDNYTILFFISFLALVLTASGQKVVNASGYCKIRIERNMSLEQATKDVVACAKKNALEQVFGTQITQEDIIRSNSVQKGMEATGSTVFQSFGSFEVKGEWIETKSEETKRLVGENGDDFIECNIKGKVRELKRKPASFETYPLSVADNPKSKATDFLNDQSVYLYFRSPSKGFLNVYLDDGSITQQLIPYKRSQLVNLPVEADKVYIFFSKNNVNGGDRVDEYQLSAEKPQEQNTFYVLFSPNPFAKPILNNDNSTLSESDLKSGFSLPKYTTTPKFMSYLQDLRNYNQDIELSNFTVLISKK
jgi:hypothetical protein